MNDEIKLFVEYQPETGTDMEEDIAWLNGADGMIVDPCHCSMKHFEEAPVERAILRNADPVQDGDWLEQPVWWAVEGELEQAARQRDTHPSMDCVPILKVERPQISYRFSGRGLGEGFSFYIPDTAAVKGWQVLGTGVYLRKALERARELGFSTLWLHSPEAQVRRQGLELDLLEQVAGGGVNVWLSGGASELRHLRNAARCGGAAGVVVSKALAKAETAEHLREALVPEKVQPEAVPIHFERRPTQAG